MKMKHAQYFFVKNPETGMYARLNDTHTEILWDAPEQKKADLFDNIAVLFAVGMEKRKAERWEFLAWCSRMGGRVRSVRKTKAIKRNVQKYLRKRKLERKNKKALEKMLAMEQEQSQEA